VTRVLAGEHRRRVVRERVEVRALPVGVRDARGERPERTEHEDDADRRLYRRK